MSKLRCDAARNRDRLVEAAGSAFAEEGLGAPLESIAERAGVGIGTLYRRFPSRQTLVAAVFEERVVEYARAAERALAQPDPWAGFSGYVEQICAMQAADRGAKDILTRTFPHAPELEAHRQRGYELSVRLIDRAKAAGALRADFVPEDLLLLLMANAGVVEATAADVPHAWRRFVGYMLEAFRANGTREIPVAPSPRAMLRSMLRAGRA